MRANFVLAGVMFSMLVSHLQAAPIELSERISERSGTNEGSAADWKRSGTSEGSAADWKRSGTNEGSAADWKRSGTNEGTQYVVIHRLKHHSPFWLNALSFPSIPPVIGSACTLILLPLSQPPNPRPRLILRRSCGQSSVEATIDSLAKLFS
ncbi:hypothetical protein F5051DRAFT_437315 [Lentinula edodes]|nr:hypothetical protein F5051DRAFT_437315 [Lentinula edodes]